jgi:hypothetical protein
MGDSAVSRGFSRPAAILRLSISAAILGILGGCGPAVSQNDLGTVVYGLPIVAGADKPYPMPQLGPPSADSPDHHHNHADHDHDDELP